MANAILSKIANFLNGTSQNKTQDLNSQKQSINDENLGSNAEISSENSNTILALKVQKNEISSNLKLKDSNSCDENELSKMPTLPNDDDFAILANFFSIFSDPTRLKIISALSKNELCVHELCSLLNAKQSNISQHLKALWQVRVVSKRKVGLHVFYRCDDEHIEKIYTCGYEHVKK